MEPDNDIAHRSVLRTTPVVAGRKLAKVPFVEFAEGRVQGVVSSGSDIRRVYVSSINADDHGFCCVTNNNRPCGGAGGHYMCKHLELLLAEAVVQYGFERTAKFLRLDIDDTATNLRNAIDDAHHEPASSAQVFSRFLRYLTYLELPTAHDPLPELAWFPTGGR